RHLFIRECIAEIIWRVTFASVGENLLLVFEDTGSGENARGGFVRRVYRSRIDERLKYRARLPHRVGRAIELVLQVITAANHRNDLACSRTNGDERCVQISWRTFRKTLIELIESVCDRFVSNTLQIRVYRRINSQMLQSFGVSNDLRQFLD